MKYITLLMVLHITSLLTATNNQWLHESLYNSWGQSFEINEILLEEKSEYQHLLVFRNQFFGKVLALDNVVQTTERDEFAYHEMLAHVPIIAHGSVEKVLIIGGGDGGCLRQVLKHPQIKEIVLVEIDASVIELGKQYFPNHAQGAFDDPRVTVVIQDAMRYVQETDNTFDVIISDCPDPIGPGEVLFEQSFFGHCRNLLNAGGIFVNQNGVPFVQADELKSTNTKLKHLFKEVKVYLTVVPSYVGGFMTFGWATDSDAYQHIPLETLEQRAEHLNDLHYYTPAVHKAAFTLPKFIENMLT